MPLNGAEEEEEEDEDSSSDKESLNSNLILNPKVITKSKKKTKKSKKNKFSDGKQDILWKIMFTFLSDENIDIKGFKKSISSNKCNNKFGKKKEPSIKGFNLKKRKNKGSKRSSLCTGLNIQIKNRNRHVTFTQKINDGNHKKFRELLKKGLLKNNSDKNSENDNSDIRRVKNK